MSCASCALLKRTRVTCVTQIIDLEPTSYRGYERKHAALHGMKRYNEAFGAFEIMLSRLKQPPDPDTHGELFH